jgi:hypothetical protein
MPRSGTAEHGAAVIKAIRNRMLSYQEKVEERHRNMYREHIAPKMLGYRLPNQLRLKQLCLPARMTEENLKTGYDSFHSDCLPAHHS